MSGHHEMEGRQQHRLVGEYLEVRRLLHVGQCVPVALDCRPGRLVGCRGHLLAGDQRLRIGLADRVSLDGVRAPDRAGGQ